MATMPMFDPTGQVRQIPADQAPAAIAAGGKSAVKIFDPAGTPRWIPEDQQDAAIKAGGKLATSPAGTPPGPPDLPDNSTLTGQAQEALAGVKKGVSETGLTAMHVLHAIPGVGGMLDKTGFGKSEKETETNANAPVNTIAGKTGYALENIAEFMGGEEALKGLSMGEKMMKIAPVLKQLEKYPRLAKVLETAIGQGTVGTAQAAVHGEDATGSLEAGAATGATGGAAELALPALSSGMRSLMEKIRPGTAEIAGETVPVLASQRPDAAPIAAKSATTADTPAVAKAQQAGGQQAVTNVAQKAAKDALDKVNALRVRTPAITDPARLLEAPEGSRGFEFHIAGPPPEPVVEGSSAAEPRKKQTSTRTVAGKGSGDGATEPYNSGSFKYGDDEPLPEVSDRGDQPTGSHKEPVWQYLAGTKPGSAEAGTDVAKGGGKLVTTDPRVAQSTLTRLDDVMQSSTFDTMPKEQQVQIKAAHSSLQDQLGMYHAADRTMPHFEPVDVNSALQHVTNFAEAADQVEATAKPVYQKLDEVSGGKFTALRNQSKAASKVMFQPGSVEAYQKALDSKAEADQGIQELFNRHSGDVSRQELTGANSAWRDAQVLNNLHATVEGSFRGAPKNIADTLGQNRILRGNTLTGRLNRLLQKTPQSEVERVIGKDGLQNLYRVSDLLSTPESALKSTNAARAIGMHLLQRTTKGALIGGVLGHIVGHPFEGAAAGALAEDAARYVLRQAAINPRVGMLFDRAVRHQVDPKIFAPLIAAAINDNQEHHQQEPTQ